MPIPAGGLGFGSLIDLGWMICSLALCGAVAMHPAMRKMTRHAARPYETSRARLVVLTVAWLNSTLQVIWRGRRPHNF